MKELVNVIVPGTVKMSTPPHPDSMRVTVLPRGLSAKGRRSRWRRWAMNAQPVAPARELYGNGWGSAFGAIQAPLWVASAGYGLIPADQPIAPYYASFVSGRNCVVSRADPAAPAEQLTGWWADINLGFGGGPRDVAALADQLHNPEQVLIVAGPAEMITALQEDLVRAGRTLGAERFVVLASDNVRTRPAGLAPYLLEVDRRQVMRLGGLHAVVGHVLRTCEAPTRSACAEAIAQEAAAAEGVTA